MRVVDGLRNSSDQNGIIGALKEIVPEFQPENNN